MSSMPDSLTRRPPRTVPTLLAGILLLALGGLATWILGVRLIEGAWPEQVRSGIETVAGVRMDSVGVLVTAGVLALLGLILLLAAIIPGDPANRRVLEDEIPGETAVSTRDIARRARTRIERVDGVQSVSARVKGKTLDVQVSTPIDDAEGVRHRSLAAADLVLAELRPTKTLRARVRVRRTR